MRFQLINPGDPEQVFITVKNTSAAATAVGDWCVYDYTTEADGVSVIVPTAVLAACPAGVWTEVVADDGYGEVQCWGHCTFADLAAVATAGVAGDTLVLSTLATGYCTTAADFTTEACVGILGEAVATGTVANTDVTVHIRCL